MIEHDIDISVEEEVEHDIKSQKKYMVVLYNDDFNTFEFVIDSLIEICNHTVLQAEQCTMLIHYKGKCAVKEGSLKSLKPVHEAFLEKGITSKIETK